jgi:phosphatidylglycerol:prolipoprotein diacylglycerol transferase
MIAFFPSRTVAVSVAGFGVHWYGLLYLLAFLTALVLLPRLQQYRDLKLTRDDWLTLLSSGVLGVIIGGRLGYVLWYQPAYYLAHPTEVFAVWNGGMAFHGGFLGVVIAILLFCRKRGVSVWRVADAVVVPAAIGLAFGRVGNLINQELYGTVTSLPWGIAIPGVEGLRHPTPFYELCCDLLTSLVCYLHLRRLPRPKPGRTFAIFLMLYGFFRFVLEYLRQQDYPWTQLGPLAFTRAQLLTAPMFVAGIALWWWIGRRTVHATLTGSASSAR